MTWWLVLLLITAVLIVAGLAFYAGKLLWLLQQQKQQQQLAEQKARQQQQEKRAYLQESIVLISRAMLEQQCEFSEGALRLWVLLDHWPAADKPDAISSYPGIYQMYLTVKDMPTHQARKDQDKNLTRQQDKVRLTAEKDLKAQIEDDLRLILARFQQA